MSNVKRVIRQPIYIDLGDGHQRQIKFTLSAFAKMEEKYGSVKDALAEMEKGNMSAVGFIVYCGVSSCNKEISQEDVCDLIDIRDMEYIVSVMTEAMGTDNNPPENKENPNS